MRQSDDIGEWEIYYSWQCIKQRQVQHWSVDPMQVNWDNFAGDQTVPPNQLLSHLYDSQLINAPFVAIYLILSVSISERVGQVFVVMSTGARFLRAHETRNRSM